MQNFIPVKWDVNSFTFAVFKEFMAAALTQKRKTMAFHKENRFLCSKPRVFVRHGYAGTTTLIEERLTDSGSLSFSLPLMSSR